MVIDREFVGIATGALKALLTLPIRMYMPSEETLRRNTKHKGGPTPPPPGLPSKKQTMVAMTPPRIPKLTPPELPRLPPQAPPRTRLPKPEF